MGCVCVCVVVVVGGRTSEVGDHQVAAVASSKDVSAHCEAFDGPIEVIAQH